MKAKWFRYTMRAIFNIATPNFWRRALFHYVRLRVTLDNGRVVKFNAENAKFNLNASNRSYDLDGMREYVMFRVDQIVSVNEVRWW